MSDLNRRALQPIYDYCRSCLPQFALAIREADDEIERLERAVDQEKLVHLDFIGELQEKIERLEGANKILRSWMRTCDEYAADKEIEALDKEQT